MYRNGHVGVALLVFAPVGAALVAAGDADLAFAVGVGTLWLAMLPDVDHRLPGVSHRGVTHTVAFAVVVAAVLGGVGLVAGRMVVPWDGLTAGLVGVAVGLLSVGGHLLADVLTPMGIRPFWPLSRRRFTLALLPADSRLGNAGLLALGVFATGVWVWWAAVSLPR